jgi:hypothetical protein
MPAHSGANNDDVKQPGSSNCATDSMLRQIMSNDDEYDREPTERVERGKVRCVLRGLPWSRFFLRLDHWRPGAVTGGSRVIDSINRGVQKGSSKGMLTEHDFDIVFSSTRRDQEKDCLRAAEACAYSRRFSPSLDTV